MGFIAVFESLFLSGLMCESEVLFFVFPTNNVDWPDTT